LFGKHNWQKMRQDYQVNRIDFRLFFTLAARLRTERNFIRHGKASWLRGSVQNWRENNSLASPQRA
jgi:hypothetical protein